MGAKVDTTGIEFLEGDGPVKPSKLGAAATIDLMEPGRTTKRKPVKQPVNTLQGVSSGRLVSELTRRHYKVVLSCLFWMGVGGVIVILTRG